MDLETDSVRPSARSSRRQLIKALGLAGLSLLAPRVTVNAAHAISAPAAGKEGRFIFVFLRGGLDALHAIAPVSDPELAALRPNIANTLLAEGIALPGTGLSAHPSCGALAELFATKELLFCLTAGTTDTSRSHFQAQDLFEIGSGAIRGQSGFMARLAIAVGVDHPESGAISFTREIPLAFQGGDIPPEVAPLSGSGLRLPEGRVLDAIRTAHAGLKTGEAITQAIATQGEIEAAADMEGAARGAGSANGFPGIAGHLGAILKANRHLALSFIDLGGFDTHAAQERILALALKNVCDGLRALKESLGDDEWARTRVAVMSEFGRTARENGTLGTDHGHGGLFLLAGGAISGGRMVGIFSGLSASALREGRELPAASDWRALLSATIRDTFGVSESSLDRVFPGRPQRLIG